MNTLGRMAFVVLCSLLPTAVLADGLIYQLPPDGTWARFQFDGTGEEPDGKVVTVTGNMTLSSVGVAEVDGEACRWIEFGGETKVNDQSFTQFHKLLIPEKHLGKGQDPLAAVRKAWIKDSRVANGTATEIQDLKGTGRVHRSFLRPFLHGPIKDSKELSHVLIESKLGKLECAGVTAQEKSDMGANSFFDSTYIIRLHPTAPFGVVTHEGTRQLTRNGQEQGKMVGTMKLVDFGKDAKSKLPDSK